MCPECKIIRWKNCKHTAGSPVSAFTILSPLLGECHPTIFYASFSGNYPQLEMRSLSSRLLICLSDAPDER